MAMQRKKTTVHTIGAGLSKPVDAGLRHPMTEGLASALDGLRKTPIHSAEQALKLIDTARQEALEAIVKPFDDNSMEKYAHNAYVLCAQLRGHFISRFNGVNHEYALVTDVGREGNEIIFDTLSLFKYNRIGDPAIMLQRLSVGIDELNFNPNIIASGKCIMPGKPTAEIFAGGHLCKRGIQTRCEIDRPEALDKFRQFAMNCLPEIVNTLDALLKANPVQQTPRRRGKNRRIKP